MALRFVNHRVPTHASCTELEREQVRKAGIAYDGDDHPAEVRLAMLGDDEGPSWGGFLERWDVVDDDGVVSYDAWIYMVDSGTFYTAGTTDEVGGIIQFAVECDDRTLAAALQAALEARPKVSG